MPAEESKVGSIWSNHHYSTSDISQYDLTPAPFLVGNIPHFKANGVKKVVDAGCGQGRNLLYLLQQGFYATGIDASKSALDLVRQLLNQNNQDAQLIEADLDNTGLDSGSIDAVVAITVLTHFSDPSKIIAEFYRILGPGGYLLADFATKRDETYKVISRGRKVKGVKDAFIEDGTEVRYYDKPEEVIRLLDSFKILKLDEVQFEEQGHPISRPYPHTHSSFVVLAQKE